LRVDMDTRRIDFRPQESDAAKEAAGEAASRGKRRRRRRR